MARKSTGKRQRFEIFKRDGFRCAYCGRSPPDVLLQVDHIVPVAGGGGNEPTNLITSCQDCNAGKSDKPLTEVAPPLQQQAKAAKERAEQVKAYADAMLAARESEDETVKAVALAWYSNFTDEPEHYRFPAERVPSVKRFIGQLPMSELMDAIDVAVTAQARKPDLRVKVIMNDKGPSLTDGSLFRYFCGVCWRKIKDREEAYRG